MKNSVILYRMHRDNVYIAHERRIYSFLDLMGDLGGVMEIVSVVVGFFLFCISEHSFYMGAIEKLFLADTKDASLFQVHDHGYS